ncbi:MAG TPA: pseudouridine synthase [Bacteroidales bacterium]|nr:pseudouridine synthase [Bacteroidales bacterium]
MSAKQSSGRRPGEKRPRIAREDHRENAPSIQQPQAKSDARKLKRSEGLSREEGSRKPELPAGRERRSSPSRRDERTTGRPFSATGKTTRKPRTENTSESTEYKPYGRSGQTKGKQPFQSSYDTRRQRPEGDWSGNESRPAKRYGKAGSTEGKRPFRSAQGAGRPRSEGERNAAESSPAKHYGKHEQNEGKRIFSGDAEGRRPSAKGGRYAGSGRTSGSRFGKTGGGNISRAPKNKPMTEGIERKDKNTIIRLNKYLADAGICSRREADKYIQAGVVSVNDKVVTELGSRVNINDKVEFEGQVIRREKLRYVLLNKPKGYITTSDDPYERKTVMELVAGACEERLYPVGRLDRNTTGLLLLTNDGDLAKTLTHPSHGAAKLYHVWLDKPLTRADLRKISEGVELEDGLLTVDAVDYVAEDETHKQVGLQLHSGRNRVVRRLFEHLGYEVVKLDRAVFAGLTKLKLSRGHWRFLTPAEITMLKRIR